MLTYLLESCLGDLVLILHPNATDPQSVEKLATTNKNVAHHLIYQSSVDDSPDLKTLSEWKFEH